MSGDKLKLSHTKIQTWMHCRQKYVWIYHENLAPLTKSHALKLGDIVHQLLHFWAAKEWSLEDIQDYNKVKNLVQEVYQNDDEDYCLRCASEASTLVSGWINAYGNDPVYHLIPGETTLEHDMGQYILTGRTDAWARDESDLLWRVEYKTAARIDKNYLSGLTTGLQGSIYDYLTETLFNETLQGTMYNMLIKTKIPKFERAMTRCNRKAIDRMLEAVEGTYRSIQRGDFYKSARCYSYGNECPYKVLCEHDSPGARKAFFTHYKPEKGGADEETVNGKGD